MKVLDLRCAHDHTFEGWFASEEDFVDQQARHLITCPMCGDEAVTRLPSAPRLNLSTQRDTQAPARSADAARSAGDARQIQQQLQQLWLRAVRHVMANSEDVGERFAEEARRIHYQETPERNIHGVASPEEAAELIDEGIEVLPLPLPADFKDRLQ
ncbi:hypothetical protein PATSB16_26050 [Pandoraea thiooxydans]|uniref:Uncharacterized protein n=1 Tax=Pandoraea thiooxydans TaxID=445709 RepID=A0A0G3EV11_9BURK|nr:DUF1178 family protein [Pandoraea thiooxydans]AKJ68541.1 hypothetical protein ABW99_10280 [Pandoraea thiooxydans]APR95945.1 hypothetical protein PATSB16_26050 [Pandoraea thiooxydans]